MSSTGQPSAPSSLAQSAEPAVIQFRLERGLCHACGTKIYEITKEGRPTALTIPGVVLAGRCLFCYPDCERLNERAKTDGNKSVKVAAVSPEPPHPKRQRRRDSAEVEAKRQSHVIRDAEGLEYVGIVTEGTENKGKGRFSYRHKIGEFQGKTSFFEGAFEDGTMEGHGHQKDASGCIYEGEFHRGKAHGYGICKWPTGWIYEGEWRSDLRHGQGTCRQDRRNGEVYNGHWEEDMWHGKGHLLFAGGGEYKGEFLADKIHGRGRYVFADGDVFEGSFKDGCREGRGEMVYTDGCKYVGSWRNNWRNGQGSLVYPNGRVFKGSFRDDEPYDGILHNSDDGIVVRIRNGRQR